MSEQINIVKHSLVGARSAIETINKTKRQPMEWEKVLANDANDKRLISRIHKHLV